MAKKRRWRRYRVEFKRQVVERMQTCENIGALARELDLQRKLLYTWKYQLKGRPEPRHANLGKTAEERKEDRLQREIARLKAALGEKTLEIDFFRSALRRIAEERQKRTGSGASPCTPRSARGSRRKAQ